MDRSYVLSYAIFVMKIVSRKKIAPIIFGDTKLVFIAERTSKYDNKVQNVSTANVRMLR